MRSTESDDGVVVESQLDLPVFQSGKWYAFPERSLVAYPANTRGYLSAIVQGRVASQVPVSRAKYVGTLELCTWFPSMDFGGGEVLVDGVESPCHPEDVCVFLQLPPEHERINGALWIAFALHKSDVSDFVLDQAR